ncbi:hypothetical protein, partial [Streptomyces eurocidicus]|uniref:hypothetical protein n=1 Tax=Streptomyces eurocidicus TaxID=66423 RepID=UPI00161CC7CC
IRSGRKSLHHRPPTHTRPCHARRHDIGAVLARRIARDVARPVLVLVGRWPRDGRVDALLGELRAMGAEARYERADGAARDRLRRRVPGHGRPAARVRTRLRGP